MRKFWVVAFLFLMASFGVLAANEPYAGAIVKKSTTTTPKAGRVQHSVCT